MEGIAKITLLKMQDEEFKNYVTVVPDGNYYKAKFTFSNEGKYTIDSRITCIQEFISTALDRGWKITLMEVE